MLMKGRLIVSSKEHLIQTLFHDMLCFFFCINPFNGILIELMNKNKNLRLML